jgi:hypothetical protein
MAVAFPFPCDKKRWDSYHDRPTAAERSPGHMGHRTGFRILHLPRQPGEAGGISPGLSGQLSIAACYIQQGSTAGTLGDIRSLARLHSRFGLVVGDGDVHAPGFGEPFTVRYSFRFYVDLSPLPGHQTGSELEWGSYRRWS